MSQEAYRAKSNLYLTIKELRRRRPRLRRKTLVRREGVGEEEEPRSDASSQVESEGSEPPPLSLT
jgi:hypothetical protein